MAAGHTAVVAARTAGRTVAAGHMAAVGRTVAAGRTVLDIHTAAAGRTVVDIHTAAAGQEGAVVGHKMVAVVHTAAVIAPPSRWPRTELVQPTCWKDQWFHI